MSYRSQLHHRCSRQRSSSRPEPSRHRIPNRSLDSLCRLHYFPDPVEHDDDKTGPTVCVHCNLRRCMGDRFCMHRCCYWISLAACYQVCLGVVEAAFFFFQPHWRYFLSSIAKKRWQRGQHCCFPEVSSAMLLAG